MQTIIKIIVLLFCMNLMLYFGLNYEALVTGNPDDIGWSPGYDIIDTFMNSKPRTLNSTVGDISFSGNISGQPNKDAGVAVGEANEISYLDALAIAWSIVPTLFSVMTSGIALFFVPGLPPFFAWMIGVPMLLIYALAIFAMIRGVGD